MSTTSREYNEQHSFISNSSPIFAMLWTLLD